MSGTHWTRQPGFTLAEIIIVIIMLGILSALVVPIFFDATTDAKMIAATRTREAIQLQIDVYHLRHGSFPEVIDPGWFGVAAIPPNPFFPEHQAVINYDISQVKYHPITKYYHPHGAFWYSPLTGRFRARVAQQDTDQETLRMYNLVNQSNLADINAIR